MLKIIAKITLIAYCYNLLLFTAIAMEDCGGGYGGRRYSISSLSTDGSEYGFSLTTDSDSDDEDGKILQSYKPETVTFTPELMTDSSQQEALEKTLKLSGKIVWSESGVSWSTNDGLVLSFDWSGVLTIASSSNHLDVLTVNPYSFATFNRIILGDNLRLDRLLLQSPKVINSGRNNFIESLTVNNLPNSEDGLFINDSGCSLMVNDFYSEGINLINQGSLTINKADLQYGDLTNHGSLLGNSFKNIGGFYNRGSLLSNKDLSGSDILKINCKVFFNNQVVSAFDWFSLTSDTFINHGAINLSKGEISSNSFHNQGEVIVLDSLEAKVNSFTNEVAGKIVFNNNLKVEPLNTDIKVSLKNAGNIANATSNNSGESILDLTADVINDGVITFGGKTLLRNSRLVNTGKGFGTFATLNLLGGSSVNNSSINNTVINSGTGDHDETNGLIIDVLSSINGGNSVNNTVINSGFLRVNLLKGIFSEVKNAGLFSIQTLGEKDNAVTFTELNNKGLLTIINRPVIDASIINRSVNDRSVNNSGQLSVEQGENSGTINGNDLVLQVSKKLKNSSDGVIQVNKLTGDGTVENRGKVYNLTSLEVKDFTNYGVFANDSLTLKPSQSFSNETEGVVATKQLQADNLSNKGLIESDKIAIKNYLTNHGKIITSDVDGYYINNHGEIVSKGNLRIATREFTNKSFFGQKTAVVKTDGNLTLSACNITADNDSIIEAVGAISLYAGSEIDLAGKVITNHSFNLQSNNLKTTAKITSNGNYQNSIKVSNNLQTFNDKTKTPKKKDYPFSTNSRSIHGSEIIINGKLAVEASSWVHEGLLAIKDDGVIKVKDLSINDKGSIIGHSGQKSTAQLDVTATALKGNGHVQFANITIVHNSNPLSLKVKVLDKLSYNSSCPLTLTGIVEGKRLIIQGDVLNQGNLLAHESITIEGTFLNDSNGKADLTGLTLKAKKPIETFINKGELSLKQIKSLGRDYLDLENFGKLHITDHFITDHLKLGKVLNQRDATIGFGMGVYYTGIFTNYGKEIILPGQRMYSEDIFNHGEMHAQGRFTIDCHNGLFSKLGKVFVDGKLLIEVGEKFNGFDLLKNSDISSNQAVEVKAPTFTVNAPLTLRGDWYFNSSNFKVNNRLTADNLLIGTQLFTTGSSASQFGDVFALGGDLTIYSYKIINNYGNLFAKNKLTIHVWQELINGCKDENIKDIEGLFDKNGASITSIADMELTSAGSINNNYGYIITKGKLAISADSAITNQAGLIQGEKNAKLKAKKILITRDAPYSWSVGKGCGGHEERRGLFRDKVWRHHNGCNCNGYSTNSKETSVQGLVNILGNDRQGLGNLQLIGDDIEILASTIAATGDIDYGKELNNLFRLNNYHETLLGNFKLTARNGKNAQIKSKGMIRLNGGAIDLRGGVEGVTLQINSRSMLLECLGIDSRQVHGSFTINLTDYANRLATSHGLIANNQVATLNQPKHTLSVPLEKLSQESLSQKSDLSTLKRTFYGDVVSRDITSKQSIPFETSDDVAALITKILVADFFKAAKLNSDLFTKLHTNSGNREIISDAELQRRVESLIYYKVVNSANSMQKAISEKTIHTMLFIGSDDQSTLGLGEIKVDKEIDVKVKKKLEILSGVMQAQDILIAADSVDVATKVIRENCGASYHEYFLKQASLQAKDKIVLNNNDTFSHKGALFQSGGNSTFSFIKEIGSAAIARRLDVHTFSHKGKITTNQSYSEQGISSQFIANDKLIRQGEKSTLTGTKIYSGKETLNQVKDQLIQDLYLTTWNTTTTTGKKGLFVSTPSVSYYQSATKPNPYILSSKEAITLGTIGTSSKTETTKGINDTDSTIIGSTTGGDTILKGGVIDTPHLIKQGKGNLIITPSTGKVEHSYTVSGKNPFGSIYYGQTTTTTTLNNPQLHVDKISTTDGAKGYFTNCKLDGIQLELDYQTAVQHITTSVTQFGNSKGNGWDNTVKALGIAVSLGVQLATSGMGTPILMGALSTLASTAATTFANNGGNIADTCNVLSSKENIQNLAINAATNYLAPHTASTSDSLTKFIANKLYDESTKGVIDAGLQTAIKQEDFTHTLKSNMKGAAINTIAATGAKIIGDHYKAKEIDYLTHKFLHGVNGALTGMLLDGKNGAIAGAIGSVTAETILDDLDKGAQSKLQDQCITAAQEQEHKTGKKLTPQEFQKLSKTVIEKELVKAKISSSIAAAIFNQDPNTALLTASHASENNMIPMLVMAGLHLWGAYDLYQTYQKYGEEATLHQLALMGVITVVFKAAGPNVYKAWKVSGIQKPFTNATEAIAAYLKQNPTITQSLTKLDAAYSKTHSKLTQILYQTKNKIATSKDAETIWHKTPVQRGINKEIYTSKEMGDKPVKKLIQNESKVGTDFKWGVTKHSVSRKIERNIKSIDELNTLKNPLKIREIKIDPLTGRKSQRFIGEKVEVVINPETNNIISVNPIRANTLKKLINSGDIK